MKRIISRNLENTHITVIIEGTQEDQKEITNLVRRMQHNFRHSSNKKMSFEIILPPEQCEKEKSLSSETTGHCPSCHCEAQTDIVLKYQFLKVQRVHEHLH